MTIFQLNRRRSHKFVFSGLLFGFCMARITTCVLRIAWSTRLTNIRLAIAAQVFVAAGVLLLFVVNLIFTQRILRATHPRFGWHKALSRVFSVYYATIVLTLIMLIVAVVQSFYTRNPDTLQIDASIQRYGSTYFAVSAFLPLPMLFIGLIIPRHSALDKFGWGRFRVRVALLVFSSIILTLGAAFRAGIGYLPRPASDPAWYHSKACFYIFNFSIEILVVFLYAVMRVDLRFHVPDGAKRATGYQGRLEQIENEKMGGGEKATGPGVLTEEEFADEDPLDKPVASTPAKKEQSAA